MSVILATFGSGSAVAKAAAWIVDVLLGSVGKSIAVVAIAWVGFVMLSGRISARRGIAAVVGCFLLFGAPSISRALLGSVSGGDELPPSVNSPTSSLMPAFKPPPPQDPYAGAAVPQ